MKQVINEFSSSFLEFGGDKSVILDKVVCWLFLLLIFLNPFPHTTFFDQLFLYIALIPAIILVTRYRKAVFYQSSLFYPLCIYLLWSIISAFFALDKADSFHALYSHLIRYLIFYAVLINFFNTRQRLIWVSICIVLSEVIFASGMLIYQYGILEHPLNYRMGRGFSAVAIDIMPFGFIMGALLSGWLLTFRLGIFQKIVLAGAMLLLLVATILTQSKGAIIALGISFPIFFWKHKKMFLVVSIVTIALVMQTPLKNRIKPDRMLNDPARKALICYSIEIIKDYPILGTGFSIDTFRDGDLIDKEKYSSRLPEHLKGKVQYLWPHNMLLHMGVRAGVIGILVYLNLFVVSVFTSFKLIFYGQDVFIKNAARCCLALIVMFAVNGLVQPVFVHFLDTIFFGILSMVTIVWKINEDAGKPEYSQQG